jgi:multisubunit Na+/H+ antiporter MnhE subunit
MNYQWTLLFVLIAFLFWALTPKDRKLTRNESIASFTTAFILGIIMGPKVFRELKIIS